MANTVAGQPRRNAVAPISLVVAVSCLSYSTWRNEATGGNCNLRFAVYEILLKLGELQRVVFHAHYDRDPDKGNLCVGRGCVLTIGDLASVLTDPMRKAAADLQQSWAGNREDMADSAASLDLVMQALDAARSQILDLLLSLE